MTSFQNFISSFPAIQTVFKIINKEDVVEKKVNNNTDQLPSSYLQCPRHFLCIVKAPSDITQFPQGLTDQIGLFSASSCFFLTMAKCQAEIINTILIKIGVIICMSFFQESLGYLGTKVKLDYGMSQPGSFLGSLMYRNCKTKQIKQKLPQRKMPCLSKSIQNTPHQPQSLC